MRSYTVVFWLASIIALTGCKSYVDLDSQGQAVFTWQELPREVQMAYINNMEVANGSVDAIVVDLDKDHDVKFRQGGKDGSYTKQIMDNNYYFNIEGRKFKASGNKGDPFIFFNEKFYYSMELNLGMNNYEQAMYYQVDLSSFLK